MVRAAILTLLLCSTALADTVRIDNDPGGRVLERRETLSTIYRDGHNVEVTGRCLSACTMVLSHIPKDRLCFGPRALLGFHLAASIHNRMPQHAITEYILNDYPPIIKKWIKAKGGVYQMPEGSDYWYLSAPELWAMGFSRCTPDMAKGDQRIKAGP